MSLIFEDLESDKIRRITAEIYASYKELAPYDVYISRTRIKGSTMQATPVIRWDTLFTGMRAYRLSIAHYVRDSKQIKVDSLDDDVLRGWLAHEFGHLVDYTRHSLFGMIIYGIRYLLFDQFARKVEHEADLIAVHHGHYRSILRTKEFLFGDDIAARYQQKLRNRYMSVKDLEICNGEWEISRKANQSAEP